MSLEFTASSILQLPHKQEKLHLEGLIGPREIVGLQGPSGCGKSSLLRALAQVGTPLSYKLDGSTIETLAPDERKISLVFQKALLFPHLSVAENLRFPLRFQPPYNSWSRSLQDARVKQHLHALSLSHLESRAPHSLSGGEAMRVALLRAIISVPRCLLLDEAFSALDKDTKAHVKSWLKDIIRQNNVPTLLVAHVDDDMRDFCDRVISWPQTSSTLRFS